MVHHRDGRHDDPLDYVFLFFRLEMGKSAHSQTNSAEAKSASGHDHQQHEIKMLNEMIQLARSSRSRPGTSSSSRNLGLRLFKKMVSHFVI